MLPLRWSTGQGTSRLRKGRGRDPEFKVGGASGNVSPAPAVKTSRLVCKRFITGILDAHSCGSMIDPQTAGKTANSYIQPLRRKQHINSCCLRVCLHNMFLHRSFWRQLIVGEMPQIRGGTSERSLWKCCEPTCSFFSSFFFVFSFFFFFLLFFLLFFLRFFLLFFVILFFKIFILFSSFLNMGHLTAIVRFPCRQISFCPPFRQGYH